MATVTSRLTRIVSDSALIEPDDQVVVGVSGGADSLCLLHILTQLRSTLNLTLHAAHLDHRLRGAESTADADFVRRIAADRGVPITVQAADVASLASNRKKGIEETARRERYTFLSQVAGRVGAGKIAVGHNADDQAETVLMHLMRGAGLAGLRGMAPLSPYPLPAPGLTLVRPLLSVPRIEIDAYLAEIGLHPRQDRSNLDTAYLRNRLRHQVLPLLEEVSPRIGARLGQLAELVAADEELLEALLEQSWGDLVISESGREIALNRAAWRALPLGLQRRTLRRALSRSLGSLEGITFTHIESVRRVADTGDLGAQATLPRAAQLTVGDGHLLITGGPAAAPPEWPLLGGETPLVLAIPGRTRLPGARWTVEAELLGATAELRAGAIRNPDPWCAYLDAEQAGPSLVLRSRRPGERFQPLGMGGRSSSLSDFMINQRIPRTWRDRVPILALGVEPERVLWIAGWRLDERAKVTDGSAGVLRISFHRQEGGAPPKAP